MHMVTNKAILGFFVVLIVVVLAIVLVRRNPNFMAQFGRDTENTTNEEVTPTQTAGTNNGSGSVVGAEVPSGRTICTAELKARCSAAEAPVCGYEKVVTNEGESTRALTYKSACAYCSLYGTDDVLDLGDEKYYPLGYTPGVCVVTK